MKESYEEDLANHFGLQGRADCNNNVVLSDRAEVQQASDCTPKSPLSRADLILTGKSPHRGRRIGETPAVAAESETLSFFAYGSVRGVARKDHSYRDWFKVPDPTGFYVLSTDPRVGGSTTDKLPAFISSTIPSP
ncbi:MAG: hypothetical protein O3A00_22205, partial [Planctomycetota bacterium]|nr:hypothetical protein [Planctomycetota bacterium]